MPAPRLLLRGIGALVDGDEPALAPACSTACHAHAPYAHDGALALGSRELREEQLLPISRDGMG